MKTTDTIQNPWAGLSSYEDPAKSARRLKFCGRDEATYDVAQLIDDNFLVTLYGKSGIGKTSLLNAGVFPALRREQYTPLSLRLGIAEESHAYQDIITDAVEHAISEIGGTMSIVNVVEEQTDRTAVDFLWNYFARSEFTDAEGHTVFPVVVFDQFEELFRQRETRRKTETLLKQIHYLIDESHALNDCIVDGEPYYYDFNFRFVISIREDDLYRLEDSIDNCALTALKRCRYRLRSLSEQGARDAILIPGEGLFLPEEQEGIVKAIVDKSRNEDGSISTNIVSLLCNRIFVDFQKSNATNISQTLVDNFIKGNPFERFYNEATKGFSNREKSYIEDHLVDSTGRRNSIPKSDFLLHVPNGTKLLEGDSHILQRTSTSADGGSYRVELIHDSFCAPLAGLKEQRERRRRMKWFASTAAIALLCMGVAAYILYQNNKIEEANLSMLENRNRFVAEKGQALINDHDYLTARFLALNILPTEDHPDIPFTTEAESLLRIAMETNEVILRGHTKSVQFATFSPNGKYIVSISDDKTVIVWDYYSGRQVGTLTGQTSPICSVTFSQDSKNIISVSEDKTIIFWDAKTGEQIEKPIRGDAFFILSASFSPNGKYIASISPDNIIRIWNTRTGEQVGKPINSEVNSVSFSPDEKYIASGSSDNTIRIWDITTGEQVGKQLIGHSGSILSVAFSQDGKNIVSSSADSTIRIWNISKGEQVGKPLKGHTGSVLSVSFSPDGNYIVSASEDKTIKIWDSHTGSQVGQALEGHTAHVLSARFSPDGKFIISASEDQTVRVWDTKKEVNFKKLLMGHKEPVNYATFSPDGKSIVSASDDNSIRIWNIKEGEKEQSLIKQNKAINCASYSPDGKYIVSASWDKSIRIWDAKTGKQIGKPLIGHTDVVNSAVFSPDGKYIVSASDDYTIIIWDTKTQKQVGEPLKGHTGLVLCAAFSPDGEKIVSTSFDRTIRIWDTKTRKQEGKPLEGHTSTIYSAAFSPDGKYIVSASEDRTIRIWDVKTRKQIGKTMEGHKGTVHSASFSPDGKYIVSASEDKTIRIWDAKTREQVWRPLEGHSDVVYYASFSPDGRHIVSASEDASIILWDFPSLQQLIKETEKQFKGRELTPEERKKFYLE